MIGLLIAIASCVYFFIEADKRNVSRIKWASIAFIAFLGPQLLLSWMVLPMALAAFGIPFDESHGLQLVLGITGFVIGFYLLVVARKRLYQHKRTEPPKDGVMIGSLEITSNEDGSYSVGDRTFKSKKDADAYVQYVKSIPR